MTKEKRLKYVGDALDAYLKLNKVVTGEKENGIENSDNQRLLKSLRNKEQLLKANPESGDHIPRKYITKKTIERYGTHLLWRIDLQGYWRAIYTIVGNEIEILTLILDIVDHKKYNKLFVNYKKK
ncbi:MAG: hypothetical protein J4432_01585 [DPANN group archaeon]|nr:hypothetical protein [DPANN group archaeon]